MRNQWKWLCGALFGCALAPAAPALTPPFSPDTRRETLVAVGDSLSADFALVEDSDPHLFFGSAEGSGIPFQHAWHDGFTWHSQLLSEERVHDLEVIHLDGRLHIVAETSLGGGPRGVHYLQFNPADGTFSRRQLASTAAFALDITAAPGSSTRPVVTLQDTDRSALLIDNLAGQLSINALPLQGNHAAVLDVLGGTDSPVLRVLYRSERVTGGDDVRVLRRTFGGQVLDQMLVSTNQHLFAGGLAFDNAGAALVAWSTRNDGVQVLREPFGAGPPAQYIDGPHSGAASELSFASDAGDGFATLVSVDATGNLSGVRIAMDDSVTRFGPGTSTGGEIPRAMKDVRVRANAATRYFLYREENKLYFNAPSRDWSVIDLPAGTSMPRALALAVDRQGTPTLVGEGNDGLLQSRWQPGARRMGVELVRPAGEQYAQAALAFSRVDNRLFALARALPDNDAVFLERAPGDAVAQRVTLEASGSTGHAPRIVAAGDGSVTASWYHADAQEIRTAHRTPLGPFVFATVPGTWGPDARPRLATTGSGLVYLSAYDEASEQIDIFILQGAAWQPYYSTTGPGVLAPHALAGAADGEPALLYAVRDEGLATQRPRYWFRLRGQPRVLDLATGDDVNRPISGLELALQHGSPSDARVVIARSEPGAGHRVTFGRRVAHLDTETFDFTPLGTLDEEDFANGIGLVIAADTFVTAGSNGTAVLYRNTESAAVTDPERVETAVAVPFYPPDPLPPDSFGQCICGVLPCLLDESRKLVSIDDPGNVLSTRLRERFTQTAAGQHLLGLFAEHGVEMAQAVLADPRALAHRIRTYALFAPALTAFVDGRGDEVVMTAPMLDDARAVWRFWADNGSEGLRADINAELRRTNDLRAFEGRTLDEWFAMLRTPAPGEMFGSGFE